MPLSDFIRNNIEEIGDEWEHFAGTLIPEKDFSASVLRDDIEDLLHKISSDMDSEQSRHEQSEKSKGKTTNEPMEETTEKHVLSRIHMGLTSHQLIAEFRALRASVIRLWQEDNQARVSDLYDLTRFNEAIDEALTEAEALYSKKLKKSQEIVFGVLGHDLRNPLSAIASAARLIQRAPGGERNEKLANQILSSADSMKNIIVDLVELARVSFGQKVPIQPTETDLQSICREAIDEMRTGYPGRVFRMNVMESLTGNWDRTKLKRVLSNLLENAVKYGDPKSDIVLAARKTDHNVEIQVHNEGQAISQEMQPKIFDEFVQERPGEKPRAGSTGLGLYIVKEIVNAHGGEVAVESSEKEGTTFYAVLPQNAAPNAAAAR